MTLRDAMANYVAWRRSHGARFTTSARILNRFCRGFPGGTGCNGVHESDVLRFLAGTGPLTRTRANRYGALAGFYRFAISRGLATRSPLPPAHDEPREPESAPPHIYTKEELKRLFAAIDPTTMHAIQLDGDTLRMLLLLLYGAGLRRGESHRAHHRRCRSRGGGADGEGHEVPQEPARAGLPPACRPAARLCRSALAASDARWKGVRIPRKPGRNHRELPHLEVRLLQAPRGR